jgi:hypothetical protein
MRDKLRAVDSKTKRKPAKTGLQILLQLRKQAKIRRFRGKLDWQGDLNAMRRDGLFLPIPTPGSVASVARPGDCTLK